MRSHAEWRRTPPLWERRNEAGPQSLKDWKIEILKDWRIERLKDWNIERLKDWKIERLKDWQKTGVYLTPFDRWNFRHFYGNSLWELLSNAQVQAGRAGTEPVLVGAPLGLNKSHGNCPGLNKSRVGLLGLNKSQSAQKNGIAAADKASTSDDDTSIRSTRLTHLE